jgi:hypothetical protein
VSECKLSKTIVKTPELFSIFKGTTSTSKAFLFFIFRRDYFNFEGFFHALKPEITLEKTHFLKPEVDEPKAHNKPEKSFIIGATSRLKKPQLGNCTQK